MYTTANVTLMVADFERAVRFYTEALGLTLDARHGDHWAQVVAPGITIGLHPSHGPVAGDASVGMSIGLLVDRFDESIDVLARRGVSFGDITRTERASSAYFTDPDGHSLYVMWRAPAGG